MSQSQDQDLVALEEEVYTAVTEQLFRLPPNEWQWLLHFLEAEVLQELKKRGIPPDAYLTSDN